ncbi:acetyl-CoA carboxylase biotin carboxylase subunit family protein [Legionella sp. 16cNR16C]|uniref:ATP-grasp domain-containing protein n=1 Tax=Legionella sp. 16cNR16C TaxID=2905656 RepID=UPI001E406FE6|nr:hypothetical protein [Legionella sp. 16cNR16C]MCE3045429.1 hypothetical protein [Legionella sp. 16cNR16C]
MKNKSVLLIGPSFLYDQIDFEILKENNISPIYSFKKGINQKNISDEYEAVYYEDLTIQHFIKIISEKRPDAIVCYNDNFLMQVAQLRDYFSIPGMGVREVKKFKIKSQMYNLLCTVLPTPKTVVFDSSVTPTLLRERLGEGDYFLKPDDLAGAEGTLQIKSEEIVSCWEKLKFSDERQFIIQKYYDLPLVHCELYIQQGQIKYIQARHYSYPNHLFLKGKIISSFPIQNHLLEKKIESASKLVASVLNFNNGVMHTEFFVGHDERLIFLETNIRQAGGAINLIHKKRSGVSMETAMILLELNKPLLLKENFKGFQISGYIPMQEGKVMSITLPKLKGEYKFDVRVKVGDICEQPTSASNASISFLGESDKLENLLDDFRWLENNSMIEYQNVR